MEVHYWYAESSSVCGPLIVMSEWLIPFYCTQHGKHYSSEGEYQRRLNVFADNAALVETFNREGHSYESELPSA